MKQIFPIALATVLLAGCTAYTQVNPEKRTQWLTELRSGDASLDCNVACASGWSFGGHRKLAQLYANQDWENLAVEDLRIGFQVDVGYYYLGRAAEGLGADEAALKYYRIAGALATGPNPASKCLPDADCDGITLPQDLYPRMAAVQADIDRKEAALHPVQPETTTKKKHKAPPKTEQADNSWITPPPVTR